MSLSQTKLKQEIQKFLDQEYAGFIEMPSSVSDSQLKFKTAINAYLADITVVIPGTVEPNDTQVDTSNCGDEFKDELIMDINSESLVWPNEMGNAYRDMILGMIMTPSGEFDGEGTGTLISSIESPTVDLRDNVVSTILSMCQQFNSGEEGAEYIANAIHSNLVNDLDTKCEYNDGGSLTEADLVFG